MLAGEMALGENDVQYSYDDLFAVRRAIASGELEVQFADRLTKYRSIPELLAAEQRIAQALQTTARPKQFIASVCKGL